MKHSSDRLHSVSLAAIVGLAGLSVVGVYGCGTVIEEDAEASSAQLGEAPSVIALDVPFVVQKPELPRGCEVTSLAMLLRGAGVAADKMTLAAEIDKVPFLVNGKYGNPNTGFVGDMYISANPGYGAYHAPVERLGQRYLPGRIIDLTNSSFDELLTKYVGRRFPVWIVTNATFRALPPNEFSTWPTVSGDVQITWHEHSVVITGYGPDFILINDPLAASSNRRLPRDDFRRAWEQMGRQALSYLPAADGSGAVGVKDPPPSGCGVWPDHKLHCFNGPNVPMHEEPRSSSAVVNTLRSTESWFECWASGERHATGNTTWYFTLGDDNGNRGFVPASAVKTTPEFDANPTARGLKMCD